MTIFPYVRWGNPSNDPTPRFPLTLRHGKFSIDVHALVDSGATVNVLPYSVGVALGANWDDQWILPNLKGAFGPVDTRGLVVTFEHDTLIDSLPVKLAFAWANRDNVPVILGQDNFFKEFDVCFFQSQGIFEIMRRQRER